MKPIRYEMKTVSCKRGLNACSFDIFIIIKILFYDNPQNSSLYPVLPYAGNEKEGSPNAYEPGTPERGHRGASTPPAFFKRGKGGKSALLMKQYISLTTFNSVL